MTLEETRDRAALLATLAAPIYAAMLVHRRALGGELEPEELAEDRAAKAIAVRALIHAANLLEQSEDCHDLLKPEDEDE